MSVFGAMFSGVSGLAAQSQAMGMIADNITNVNTVGYKDTTARFKTLVTSAASATTYAPGGVQSSPLALIDKQGLLQASASPTDLAITGDGFFVVNELANPTTTQGTYLFTRAGSFTPDENGALRNAAGFYLQGWPVDQTTGAIPSNRSSLTELQSVNVLGLAGTASATTKVGIQANLQASQAVSVTGPQDVTVSQSLTDTAQLTTLTAGNTIIVTHGPTPVTATFTYTSATADPTHATSPTFTTLADLALAINAKDGLQASISGAGTTSALLTVTGDPGYEMTTSGTGAATLFGAAATTAAATYDTTGASTTISMSSNKITPDFERSVQIFDSKGGARQITFGFLKQAFANKWHVEAYIEPAGDASATNGLLTSGTLSFKTDGTLDLTNTSSSLTSAISIPWAPALGLATQSITMDWGTQDLADGLSQFDGPSQLKGTTVDGALFGELSTVQVDEQGFVTALFENGVTQKIYKLPIAMFQNVNALGSQSGNAWNQTDESGVFNLQEAGVGGSGQVAPSTLEASTVDIAQEFTNMILAQRAFSASSRIITTADDMLDELIRLKR